MQQITQQSLALDVKDKINEDEEYLSLKDKHEKILEEIEMLKDLIEERHKEAVLIRKKIRAYDRKKGEHKTSNIIIQDFVRNNPGQRLADIVRYLADVKGKSSNEFIFRARERGFIVEQENGTYIVGTQQFKINRGEISSLIVDFAKKCEWFSTKECIEYIKISKCNIVSANVRVYINSSGKFEVDDTGKFFKYRLKDEYRR
jgi:hypothetical protein